MSLEWSGNSGNVHFAPTTAKHRKENIKTKAQIPAAILRQRCLCGLAPGYTVAVRTAVAIKMPILLACVTHPLLSVIQVGKTKFETRTKDRHRHFNF